jgi:hypothetical protein
MVRRASLVQGVVAALWVTASASAADPSPSTSAVPSAGSSDGSFDFGPQVWLDAPLPADASAGQVIEVGLTVWEPSQGMLVPVDGMYVRIVPASGQAKPTEAVARSDWTGHLRAQATVPAGGAGSIAVGFHGEQCDASNVCTPVDLPLRVMGTGPPPEAPRAELVEAVLGWPSGPVVAGVPFDLEVDLEPRADWDPAALGLPDRVVVTVREPRANGPDLVAAELRSTGPDDLRYLGSLTIPEAGDVVVAVALPADNGQDETIPSSVTRLQVEQPGAPGTEAPPAVAGNPAGPPMPLLAGLGALVVVAGLLIRRVFADL